MAFLITANPPSFLIDLVLRGKIKAKPSTSTFSTCLSSKESKVYEHIVRSFKRFWFSALPVVSVSTSTIPITLDMDMKNK
jgi:hypothetical protein